MGFKIFKDQIIENLVHDNKDNMIEKVIEKIQAIGIKELLCLPLEEEPL